MAPVGARRAARIAGGAANRDRLATLCKGPTRGPKDALLPDRHGTEAQHPARWREKHQPPARVRGAARRTDRLGGYLGGYRPKVPCRLREQAFPAIRKGNDLESLPEEPKSLFCRTEGYDDHVRFHAQGESSYPKIAPCEPTDPPVSSY